MTDMDNSLLDGIRIVCCKDWYYRKTGCRKLDS